MKIATVEYTGRVRNQSHRGPSGETYTFGGSAKVSVDELGDAEHFETRPNYVVDYTARGRLMAAVREDLDDLESAIADIDYNVKKSMASALDLEVETSETSDLEAALLDQAESLKQQMENQR